MQSIKSSLSKLYFEIRKYIYTRQDMEKYQDEFLLKILSDNKNTKVGRKYKFANIDWYLSYKSKVPVFHYDDYKEYIYEAVKWNENIICSDKIEYWAKTSGTTNDYCKYIPVTRNYLEENHYKWGKDTFSHYINCNPETNIFDWKGLVLGGNMTTNDFTWQENLWYISAILQLNNNYFIKNIFTEPKFEISSITDRNEKISKIIESSINQNITSTIWVTSRNIYLLQQILKISNKKYIEEVWSDYELFLTWWMDYKPFELSIRKLFHKHINIWQAYNTSEWYFWVQIDNETKYMKLLCCHEVYYEFLAIEDYHSWSYDRIVNIYDILTDLEYVLIISNSSWLYRYIIGDTIKFVDAENLYFVITGRTKQYMNSFAEQVRENHISQTITNISKKYNLNIYEYHVWSVFEDDISGYHQRLIEFSDQNFDISEDLLAEEIDLELSKVNSFYEWKRKSNILLHKPKVKFIVSWSFQVRQKYKNKLWLQNKVPKLSNNDSLIKEINLLIE